MALEKSPRTLEDQVRERLLDGLHVGLLDLPVVDLLARFLRVLALNAGLVDDLLDRVMLRGSLFGNDPGAHLSVLAELYSSR